MNETEIRKIVEHSALEPHVGEIMKLARPGVGMRSHISETGDIAPGASRLGGAPDLPPGMAWPEHNGRPIEFLTQIDLAAAARTLVLPDLPVAGWLVVFCDFQRYFEGESFWRVLYFEGDASKLVRTEYPGEPEERFSLCDIEFEPRLCLPDIADLVHRFGPRGAAEREELREYLDNTLQPLEGGPYHRLGGYPALIQSDLDDYAGWEFLMQIDSDDDADWMWGDMGKLYFWIAPEDLNAHRFEKAWCSEECY